MHIIPLCTLRKFQSQFFSSQEVQKPTVSCYLCMHTSLCNPFISIPNNESQIRYTVAGKFLISKPPDVLIVSYIQTTHIHSAPFKATFRTFASCFVLLLLIFLEIEICFFRDFKKYTYFPQILMNKLHIHP